MFFLNFNLAIGMKGKLQKIKMSVRKKELSVFSLIKLRPSFRTCSLFEGPVRTYAHVCYKFIFNVPSRAHSPLSTYVDVSPSSPFKVRSNWND